MRFDANQEGARLGLGRLSTAVLATAFLLSLASSASAASTGNPYTGTGFDISYPQCGASADPAGSFGIIGVTGGRAFTANSCFTTEYDRAPAQRSIYMNLNAAVGSTADNGSTGPYNSSGICGHGDRTCQAYNYGWKAAQHAYGQAGTRKASTWWLDIETANSWQSQVALNQHTIQGAVDFLLNQTSPGGVSNPQPTVGITSVGIYSWASAWQKIVGNWKPNLPVWYAGTSSCSVSSFTSGPVWLVQAASGVSNGDTAC